MPRKGQYQAGRFTEEWWDEHTMPEPNTGCFLWLGSVCREGRGRTSWRGKSGVLIYRIAYEIAYGPFDSSLKVCHTCDTPTCVNPDHLFLGTQKDNLRDMFAKGRARPQGRAYLGDGQYEPYRAARQLTRRPSRRRKTPLIAAIASAVSPSVALEKSDGGVIIVDPIHLMRPPAILAGWRRVIGVPAWPEDHAGPSCEWPRFGTPDEPVTGRSPDTEPSRQRRHAGSRAVRPVEARS